MKLFGLSVVLSILTSWPVYGDEWIGPYNVKYIENGTNGVYFMEDWSGVGQYTSTYACNKGAVWFPLSLGDVVVSGVLATALTAQATGVRVKFLVNGCDVYLIARAIAVDPSF